MEIVAYSRKFAVRVLLPFVIAAPVQARVAELHVASVGTPQFVARDLALQLTWPDNASEGDLVFTAAHLDIADAGIALRELRWTCTATRAPGGALACDGPLRGRDLPASRLRAAWTDGRLDLQFHQAKTEVRLDGPTEDAWDISVKGLPARWLQPLLAQLWPEGHLTGGSIGGELAIDRADDGALAIAGPLRFSGVGLDSTQGDIAAADLVAEGHVDLRVAAPRTRVAGELTVRGGELLFGPLYASLPGTPVQVAWTLDTADGRRWTLEHAHWRDPNTLDLQAIAAFEPAAERLLHQLDLRFDLADAATALPRYFDSLLGSIGLAGLKASGALRGELRIDTAGLDTLDVAMADVSIEDAAARFGANGLDGNLRLHRAASPRASALAWDSAHVHGIAIDGAELALRSADGGLALTRAANLPVLGGRIEIPRFAWTPAANEESAALDLALRVHDIDLRRLSEALGWPAFAGTLSGDIPAVHYADSVVDLQGGLHMRMFDGDVRIDALTLERPFGVAPTMTAAIAFSDLDLKPLTGAFGFGEITGRLGGHVLGLRLVDWEPVAFDAKFETSTTAKDPRRISQRAVRDLTEVGGGGLAAGLQAQVLKMFQTFGYARIGLSCTLINDVCRMGGLDGGDGGYTIVEGAGLPRVTVIGHQRQVDWPVLVARLKAATEGQAPIID